MEVSYQFVETPDKELRMKRLAEILRPFLFDGEKGGETIGEKRRAGINKIHPATNENKNSSSSSKSEKNKLTSSKFCCE